MKKTPKRPVIIIFSVLAGIILIMSAGKIRAGMEGILNYDYGNTQSDEKESLNSGASGILILVNKNNPLPHDFVPDDLVKADVPFTVNILDEEMMMMEEAAEALEELFAGALEDAIELCAVSGYRSSSYQKQLYEEKLRKKGKTYAEAFVALPGQSEHQTGLAMDVGSFIPLNGSNNYDFGRTREGKWLSRNAYKYGFIIRYPRGKEKITGYNYEPWHIRYVGPEAAREIETGKLVLEEYLDSLPEEYPEGNPEESPQKPDAAG